MNKQLNYPVLHLYENDKNIYAQKRGPEIASVSRFIFFNNSMILDSSGYCYYVERVFKIGWLYFFGFHPFFKGRTAKIGFEFRKIEELSLEEYKEIIVQKLKGGVNKDFWYSKKQIPSLIKKVQDCNDYVTIINIFI